MTDLIERARGALEAATPGPRIVKTKSVWKGGKSAKVWVVCFDDGSTMGFPAHKFTKDDATRAAFNAIVEGRE